MPDPVKTGPTPPPRGTSLLLFVSIGMLLLVLMQNFFIKRDVKQITYSEFLDYLKQNKIEEVVISESTISGRFREPIDGKISTFTTVNLRDDRLLPLLEQKGISFRGEIESNFWTNLLGWIFPFLLILAFWYFMLGRMYSGGASQGGLMTLGKSRAKIYVEKDTRTGFDDVAGTEEAIEELREIVLFLREPNRYSRLGGRTPRGILLVGPPGTGKTLLARAVAGEANVPFFSINGSEFVEMFVGLGAARVRDLFEQARKTAPCILFIDELDALGRARTLGYAGSGANDEKEQTLNQLLAELDGFDSSVGIILLAATNRPEILDPALLRAGRFDRQILIDRPDRNGREEILRIHAKKIKLEGSVELKKIAALTPGFSGADLANLINEAALVATRRDAVAVNETDFTKAIERIVAGLERKKRIIMPEEKKRVAFHEMGHATIALALQTPDRVHKISIIPRGIGALGYTIQRPDEDRYLITRKELLDKLTVLLGGRTSEIVFFNEVSTGAGDDLMKATDLARAMVTRYGMSERLGLQVYEKQEHPFLQGAFQPPPMQQFSDHTGKIIDEEIQSILTDGEQLARKILENNREFIESGVNRLLDQETLEDNEIQELWSLHGKTV